MNDNINNDKMNNSDLNTANRTGNFGIDDPRLTAWLLDELDEEEKKDLENAVKNNPELKNELDELGQTIESVRIALKNEPLPDPGGSDPLISANAFQQPKRILHWRRIITACAAVLLAAWGIQWFLSSRNNVQIARNLPLIDIVDKGATIKMEEPRQTEFDANTNSVPDTSSMESLTTKPMAPGKESQPRRPRENSSVIRQKQELAKTDADSVPPKFQRESLTSEPAAARRMESKTRKSSENSSVSKQKLSDKAENIRDARSGAGAFLDPVNTLIGREMDGSMSSVTTNAKPAAAPEQSFRNNSDRFDQSQADKNLPSSVLNESTDEIVSGNKKKMENISVFERQMKNGTEEYTPVKEKPFVTPKEDPFSTFSIDVDTASYSNIRRFLEAGRRPPEDAVKIEEIINYFKYDYKAPEEKAAEPFAVHTETAPCPWAKDHLLVKIGIKGKEIKIEKRPPLNLVFLIDTSGSMSSENKLPLVKKSLAELTEILNDKDRIAIVTYGSESRIALFPVSGTETAHILNVIDGLKARGATAGASAIESAYDLAKKHYNKNAVNRIILCTDGDFNVGITNNQELEKMIETESKSGVYLSILGFGMGNYKDNRLAILSNKGNGNYGYIDTLDEAHRLLVKNMTGTLVTIAKDVKIQVDFNPDRVAGYRLLGYDDRRLAAADFNNDKKDAGEIGAGHTVTALYEIIPIGIELPADGRIDQSRYANKNQSEKKTEANAKTDQAKDLSQKEFKANNKNEFSNELMFVKLRYKDPDSQKSKLMTEPVLNPKGAKTEMSSEFKFAAGTALFGLLLRGSIYAGQGEMNDVLKLTEGSVGNDEDRKEFVELVKKAINTEEISR